jgi:release factor glutamine methyltransferase
MDARWLLAPLSQARDRYAGHRRAAATFGATLSEIRQLLAAAVARLGGDDARAEAEMLLAHVLGRSRAWLFAWPEFRPEVEQCAAFERLVGARAGGEPIAYLTGRRGFWSLDLAVTPAVLIPRPETELLVELALARLPPDAPESVADLGTGSGAIALALARERPRARVLATDASMDALGVARGNAQRLHIDNVTFAHGDWCAALGDARFNLIVSNPPYIAVGDGHLVEGDLRYEPATALASGVDGLDAIRRICADAGDHLLAQGWLLLEHGWDQAERVRELLHDHGFVAVQSERDAAGHERVTFAQVSPHA